MKLVSRRLTLIFEAVEKPLQTVSRLFKRCPEECLPKNRDRDWKGSKALRSSGFLARREVHLFCRKELDTRFRGYDDFASVLSALFRHSRESGNLGNISISVLGCLYFSCIMLKYAHARKQPVFFGIIIRMDAEINAPHHTPHFHAYYQDNVAVYNINSIEIISGSLPKRQQRLVEAWAELHQGRAFNRLGTTPRRQEASAH